MRSNIRNYEEGTVYQDGWYTCYDIIENDVILTYQLRINTSMIYQATGLEWADINADHFDFFIDLTEDEQWDLFDLYCSKAKLKAITPIGADERQVAQAQHVSNFYSKVDQMSYMGLSLN